MYGVVVFEKLWLIRVCEQTRINELTGRWQGKRGEAEMSTQLGRLPPIATSKSLRPIETAGQWKFVSILVQIPDLFNIKS